MTTETVKNTYRQLAHAMDKQLHNQSIKHGL